MVIRKKRDLNQILESFIQKIRSRLYCWYYWKDYFEVLRLRKQYEGIQLKAAELLRIVHIIRKFNHCRLLVFGLENDSPFWGEVNKNGRNVFLEDYEPWFDKITNEFPMIEAYLVSYPCNITQWKEVLNKPERLAMNLPQEIVNDRWDVIFVDGPRGHRYTQDLPGRMSSIYMASRLVDQAGYVFAHDAERVIEDAYSTKYLGEDHLVANVRGRSLMKIFHFPE
ncbi:hypothetical protein ES705_26935 [subsurface metagenome]